MNYRVFEARVLELLYKTDVRLVPQQAAFRLGCSVEEARRLLEEMTRAGAVTMEVDGDGVIYYDIPSRPPPTGEPLSWTHGSRDADADVLGSPGLGAREQPLSTALSPSAFAPPPVVKGEKSVALAILLAFLFGPLGMIYVTGSGALVMFLINVVAIPATRGVALLITLPICMAWAGSAASTHNQKAHQLARHGQMRAHLDAQRIVFAAQQHPHDHHGTGQR